MISLLVDDAVFEQKTKIIEKILTFISDSWAESDGRIKDKWVSVVRIRME
jgi:hypothetical protein